MNLEKSLAANNRLSKVAIPTIVLTILTIICWKFIDNQISVTSITILTLVYIILITLFVKGYKSQDIFYDDNNMYLKGRDGVVTVHFSKVRRIKMTLSNATIMGLKFYQYKIEYLDARDFLVEIHFWTTIVGSEIDEFEKEIKKTNPYVKVEHWAVS
jgi:hypothetical protein